MSLDIPAKQITAMIVSPPADTLGRGSASVSFAPLNPTLGAVYQAVIWNAVGEIFTPLPPRFQSVPSVSGFPEQREWIGEFFLRCGQDVPGRRPLGYRSRIWATNQNLLSGSGFEFGRLGLVSISVDVHPDQSWGLTYIAY